MSEILIQKVFLEIPYDNINFARENKLLWSSEEKKWVIQENHPNFKSICHKYKRVNLKVPFADKDIVKANNAKWNSDKKCWETFQGNTILFDYMK